MGKNQRFPIKEEHMNSIANGSVILQTSADALPCPPPWWGELVLLSQHLRQQDILTQLTEGIRFERRRFGHYELIDFLVVLFGSAISGERTLERFYEALRPWAQPFMALFGRDRLPLSSIGFLARSGRSSRPCPCPAFLLPLPFPPAQGGR